MSESITWSDGLPSAYVARLDEGDPAHGRPRRSLGVRAWRFARWFLLTGIVLAVALTAASFGYNLSSNGPLRRPSGLPPPPVAVPGGTGQGSLRPGKSPRHCARSPR